MKKNQNTKKPRTLQDITRDINTHMTLAQEAIASLTANIEELAELKKTVGEQKTPAEPVKKTRATKKEKTVPPKTEAANPVPPSVHRRTPASVRLTPHEITLNFGSQPVRELAENDAKDFLNNPKIFWYRNTQFPDPRRYGVQPRVEQARVVKRTAPQFARSPWTVSVTIHVDGDDKKSENWGVGVYGKNKGDQE